MKVRRNVLCVLFAGAFCTVGGAAGEKKNVVSGLDVEFYATIQADASYSDSRVSPGNYVRQVDPEQGPLVGLVKNNNDDEFNLTANATRFGFLIQGPETDDWNFWGQLEFDLYGSNMSGTDYASTVNLEQNNQENRPHLQTRQAFIVIERPADRWSLLAGQTWDVVGPLNPGTLSYSTLWWAGNYGYWVPQVRLTKDLDITDDTTLQVQLAVARTIGTGSVAAPAPGSAAAYEPGADEGYPTVQGRAAVTFPGIGPDPVTVGVSGHYGEEEYDYLPAGGAGSLKSSEVETWSGCVDVTLPVNAKVKVTGEIHTGANLGRYNGGIGTTVYGVVGSALPREVRATGGWIAVALGPWNNMCYNVGYGMEECASNDVVKLASPAAEKNSCIFANAIYNFNEHSAVGLELSWWETEYANAAGASPKVGDGDALVAQVSWIYKTR